MNTPNDIKQFASYFKNDSLVLFPTDTIVVTETRLSYLLVEVSKQSNFCKLIKGSSLDSDSASETTASILISDSYLEKIKTLME